MQEQLVIPFFCPEIEKAGNRRRTRTVASSDAAITSRRDRLEKRNRIMTARYYYWTEIKRRRFDDVLRILPITSSLSKSEPSATRWWNRMIFTMNSCVPKHPPASSKRCFPALIGTNP